MRGFSYSHCQLHGSPYIRWDSGGVSPGRQGGGECRALVLRGRQLQPDTRGAWLRGVQRQLLLSLTLATDIEVRSGHGSGGGNGNGSGSVQCLALERGRDRLLLSGGLDGVVCLYRLDTPPTSPEPCDMPHIYASDIHVGGGGCRRTVIRPLALSQRGSGCAGRVEGHGGAVSSVQWYPEDPPGAFLSSSLDGSMLVWDTEHFEVAGSFQLDSKVFVAKVNNSAHAGLVACGTELHGICLCDLRTGDAVHSLLAPLPSGGGGGGGSHACVKALDWSPSGDGHLLVAGTSDGCVRLWDVRKGGSASRSYVMSFDSQQEDHWYRDQQEEDRDLLEGREQERKRRRRGRAEGQALDWSRESAAVAHRGTEVMLWGAASGNKLPQHFSPECCKTRLRYDIDIVSFGGVGDELLLYPQHGAAAAGGNVAMVALHSRGSDSGGLHEEKGVRVLRGHVDDVNAIQLSSDKSRLVTAGRDGMIFLWEGRALRWSHWPGGGTTAGRSLSPTSSVGWQEERQTRGDDFWQSDEDEELGEGLSNGGGFVPPILLLR